ncbi:MAG: hypothetical protein K9M45_07965 [Kiritimatiellales bacterium]|nr:hypothetical protein [Kiritimatiellales bacterium]
MLLTEFNRELTGRLLDFLWRQWIQLGVRASFEGEDRDEWVIDPEALWLLTASIGRHDPRLFDLAIDWISANSSFVNIPRLKSLTRQYGFDSGHVVAAMATTVRLQHKRLKWNFPGIQVPEEPEALFVNQPMDRDAANNDPVFRQFGLIRGMTEMRGMARQFNHAMPECALLRLRALVGLNARAEIYAYLCTHTGGHPSGIARETGYSQKNIQDTITDMSAAHIVFSAQLIGRKKIYAINEHEWRTLLYNPANPPQWITWPPLFRALEILWTECRKLETRPMDPLLLSGRLRELSERLYPLMENIQGGFVFQSTNAYPDAKAYSESFINYILNWLKAELNA